MWTDGNHLEKSRQISAARYKWQLEKVLFRPDFIALLIAEFSTVQLPTPPSMIDRTSRCLPVRPLVLSLLALMGVLSQGLAQVGVNWQLRSPKPWVDTLHSVVATNDRLIAAGAGNAVLQSNDEGLMWTARQLEKTDAFYQDSSIAWNGQNGAASQLLIGTGRQFWTSTDGTSWTQTDAGLEFTQQIKSVIWAGTHWAAVVLRIGQQTSAELMTSPDGENWTVLGSVPQDDDEGYYTFKLVWTGSAYLLAIDSASFSMGTNAALLVHTTDGADWAIHRLDGEISAGTITGLVWTGTQAVAVGYGFAGAFSYTSPTGEVWNEFPMQGFPNALAWTGTSLVATNSAGVELSTDGETWTPEATNLTESLDLRSLVWTGNQLVGVGNSGAIFTTPDALTWSRRSPVGPTTPWAAIAQNDNGLLVAFDISGNPYRSEDGETWIPATLAGSPIFTFIRDLVWDGTQFVGVGQALEATSPDGLEWTIESDFASESMEAVAFANNTLVAVGSGFAQDAVIRTSTDHGATWDSPVVPVDSGTLRGIARVGTLWIAVGDAVEDGTATLLTSPDAVTWTKRDPDGVTGSLSSVAGSGTLMVAVGSDQGGTVITSTNGITWTHRPQTNYVPMQSVVWTGTSFVATGYSGLAYTSTDGGEWTQHLTGTGQNLSDLIWNGTVATAAGQGGVIITSDAVPVVDFALSTRKAIEGDGTVLVEVTLSGNAATPLSIPITVAGSATSGVDFTSVPPTVNFPVGSSSQTFSITLVDDAIIESVETIELMLEPVEGMRVGQPGIHTLSILDNDGPPPVRFTKVSTSAPEHSGSVTARVQLGWPAPAALSAQIAVSGTAGGGDFTGAPTTVSFDVGESVKYITLNITDDGIAEVAETVILTLQSPIGAVLGAGGTFTLTIQDNDSATGPGSRWTLRHPRPAAEGINSIATNGTRQAIVGRGGLAMTSDDAGLTWTRRFTGNETYYRRVISLGADGFLAVGTEGHIMMSSNGSAWVETAIPGAEFTSFFGAVTNGTQTLVCGTWYDPASGDQGPVIYATRDLVSWQKVPVPASALGEGWSIAWSGTKFVLAGGSDEYDIIEDDFIEAPLILTSDDGLTWVDRSSAVAGEVYFENVIWAGDKFIAFAASKKVFTSPDGVTWTERNGGAKNLYAGVSTTGTQVLAVGAAIGASTNGTTWTQRPSGTPVMLYDVVKSPTNFIAIGGNNTVVTSPDGVAWTVRSSTVDRYSGLNGVAWSGTQFVAVGGDADPDDDVDAAIIMTSPNGVDWTPRTNAAKGGLYSVAWSGTQFVAVGTNGQIFTSANGIAWASRNSGVKLLLSDVVWTGAQFVAVGGNTVDDPSGTGPGGSVVLTSPNGTTWTRRTIPTANPLQAVCFDGHQLVAVGAHYSGAEPGLSEAAVLTSSDGVNWTLRASDVFDTGITDVAWNGSAFVATLGNFGIITSPDGLSWLPASSVPAPPASLFTSFLYSVCWTGENFVAVGDKGTVLTSPDGDTWTLARTSTPDLSSYGIAWNGATLVSVGENASIQTSGAGAVATPEVAFDQGTTLVDEAVGTVGLVVRLSSPPVAKVTVPLTLTPGAGLALTGAASDVTPPTLSLVFNPGEMVKRVNVVIKNDKLDESNETLSVQLGTPVGQATLGETTLHIITIEDDDVPPAIALGGQPAHQFVLAGTPIELVVAATGSEPLTYQWKKNNVNVLGATGPVLFIAASELTHAGAYTCTVSNGVLPAAVSAVAQVAVYEKASRRIVNAPSKDVVLTQAVAGNNLDIKWYKDGSVTELAASPPHIVYDASKKTLTIKQPILATDAGTYQCQILQTDSSLLFNANRYEVDTATAMPVLPSPITLPNGKVGVLYSQGVVSAVGSPAVANWTATGLPGGLSMNAFTGAITGYPLVAATNKTVTIKATNGLGSVTGTALITVEPLPAGVAGVWYGLVGRDPLFNKNLGSRLELSVSAAGTYTGKFGTGTATQSINGQCGVTGTLTDAVTQVLLPGNLRAVLSFGFDTTDTPPSLSASLLLVQPGNPIPSEIEFSCWHRHATPASYAGRYNFALDLYSNEQGDPSIPQGIGFGTATVAPTGTVMTMGKLSDGAAYTSTSFLGTSGEFLIYAPQYRNLGTFLAQPSITLDGAAPAYATSYVDDVAETASWNKPVDTTPTGRRTYGAGWAPIPLYLSGQRYIAPSPTSVVMGMDYVPGVPNAWLNFSEAGVESLSPPLQAKLNIRKASGVTDTLTVNPFMVTFNAISSSGAFKGTMNLTRTLNGTLIQRSLVRYEGLIIPNRTLEVLPDQGVGFFMLPQLPDINISPLPPANSTPILSGKVLVTPVQPEDP